MTAPGDAPIGDWFEANQRHLAAALARVRSALERHVARHRGAAPAASATPDADSTPAALAPPASGTPMALERLCSTFRLSPFERDVLVLCAGVELDSSFAPLCAAAQGDSQRPYPTFGLALAALPDAHWSALVPIAPLRRWRMVEVGTGHALTASPLRIDERILHFLTGVDGLDERLAGLVVPVSSSGELAPSATLVARSVATLWTRLRTGTVPPVVQLCGGAPGDARVVAAAACDALGLTLCAMSADVIPTAPHEADALIRLWQREAALSGSVLLIEVGDSEPAEGARTAVLGRFLDRSQGALLLAGRERRAVGHRATVVLDITKPTTAEQRDVWRRALGEASERLNGQVDMLVSHFNLSGQAIHSAAADALGRAADSGRELGREVWEACRVQARPRMDDLAQRIEPVASWDYLVLPDAQRQILRDIGAHVRQRGTVYETWGFGRAGARGLGISALFSGASGTGKTMAAEVLANELRLDLYRIDLSSVVSKYIGETEKNLRRIFDAAEDGGAILLFDEADALFGKRSEVRDSHDRYANIEVSYLLQRMELYRGLAILTTNLKSALDTAFLRRIRFVVQFPFPDAPHRAEIWGRIFPPQTPLDGVDVGKLAQLSVSGGNIRNIALNAAFLAADAGESVRMAHVLHAARSEYAKLERPLTETEIEGWG